VRHLLRRHNLEQHCPTKGIQTRKARQWLKELALEQLDRWEMDSLLKRWQAVDEEWQELEEKVRERQVQHPVAPLLATMPGVAGFGSLALACRLNDFGRFPRPKSVPNYWGLTPACANSGETSQRLGSITKQGSALARFILGQVVVHVLRKDARLRTWYKGVRRRRGAKIARVADAALGDYPLAHGQEATAVSDRRGSRRPGWSGEPGRGCRGGRCEVTSGRGIPVGFPGMTLVSNGGESRPPRAMPVGGPMHHWRTVGLDIPCRVAPLQSPTPLLQAIGV
jgi:hypothetical protein